MLYRKPATLTKCFLNHAFNKYLLHLTFWYIKYPIMCVQTFISCTKLWDQNMPPSVRNTTGLMDFRGCGEALENTSFSLSVTVALLPHSPPAISIVAAECGPQKNLWKHTLKKRSHRKQTPEHTDRVTCLPTLVLLRARAVAAVVLLWLGLVCAHRHVTQGHFWV